MEDKDVEITGYKFLRRDRAENRGGWCMMYYKENLNIIKKKQSKDHDNIEAIWADAVMHSQKVSIAVVYRPPDDSKFFPSFEKHIQYLKMKKKKYLDHGRPKQ